MMTPNDIDRLATWARQKAGCAVRGPLRTALLSGYPHLSRDEVTAVIDRAFSLNGQGPPAESAEQSRGVGKRLSAKERLKLRGAIARLVDEDATISQMAAYETLQPGMTFGSFKLHFRTVAGKRNGSGAPARVAEPEPEPILAPPGARIGVTTPLGTFTAEPDPDGTWRMEFSARGDLRSMLRVGGVLIEALHQPVPS